MYSMYRVYLTCRSTALDLFRSTLHIESTVSAAVTDEGSLLQIVVVEGPMKGHSFGLGGASADTVTIERGVIPPSFIQRMGCFSFYSLTKGRFDKPHTHSFR